MPALVGWEEDLHGRSLGQGDRFRGRQRSHSMDLQPRDADLRHARSRKRSRLRREPRRQPERHQGYDRRASLATSVSGRILAPSLVVGNLVFFSTLQGDTYAARTTDGKIAWHVSMGKFSPGIAAGRHYYFSLNGRLVVYRGRSPSRRAELPSAPAVKMGRCTN